MTTASGRVIALDAIRAIAIISMVIGHVANYSFLWRTSHIAYYVWDGASLFMLVSGIVVGIVYRKRTRVFGMKWAAGKLAKRAALLYVAQLVLVSLAMAPAYLNPGAMSQQFLIPGVENFGQALGWALIMGANPIYVNFLSTYVIMLLAAIPVIFLLNRGKPWLVMLVGALLYVIGLTFPQAFTLPNGPETSAGYDNATWFVLFLSGMMLGWYWRDKSAHELLRSPHVFRIAAPIFAALLVMSVIDASPTEPGSLIDSLVAKDVMAPGRFIAAWVFFLALYWVVTELTARAWGERIVRSFAVLGSRALDSIIILTLVTIIWQGYLQWVSQFIPAQIAAIATIALCWAWAYFRRGQRLSHAPSAA